MVMTIEQIQRAREQATVCAAMRDAVIRTPGFIDLQQHGDTARITVDPQRLAICVMVMMDAYNEAKGIGPAVNGQQPSKIIVPT